MEQPEKVALAEPAGEAFAQQFVADGVVMCCNVQLQEPIPPPHPRPGLAQCRVPGRDRARHAWLWAIVPRSNIGPVTKMIA
jgi:hypothetical protein